MINALLGKQCLQNPSVRRKKSVFSLSVLLIFLSDAQATEGMSEAPKCLFTCLINFVLALKFQ